MASSFFIHIIVLAACLQKTGVFASVSDPYSFFTDPDPEFETGDQYGSGSNTDPDPIRIQAFSPVNKRSLKVRFHNESYTMLLLALQYLKKINIQQKKKSLLFVTVYLLK
jgi:hypothetical protein